MRKVISAFLGAVCVAWAVCMPGAAASLNPGDATPEEIRREIVDTYREATKRADLHSFSGYCGSFVGYETYLLGIDTTFTPTHGCDAYDKYRKLDTSSGGYAITAYSAKDYTIRQALDEICADGPAYNILLGFQRGSNTADGRKYGHCMFVNAIIDGQVYFSESYSFWIDNKKHKEGEALVCDLDYFCSVYERFIEFEGIIHFTAPGIAPASGVCGDNIRWHCADGTLTISGQGQMWDGAPWKQMQRTIRNVEISDGITAIGANALRGFKRLTKIELPPSVARLGAGAFADCPYLASVNLGNTVTEIGAGAFDNCPSLSDYQVENNPRLRALEDGTLLCVEGDKLVSCVACRSDTLTVPEDITAVAAGAFRGGRMKTIVLGKNVQQVEAGAFSGCDSLKEIRVASGSAYFRESRGALLSADGKTLYAYVSNNAWVGVPAGVERIGDFAFASCPGVQEIQIAASVREIAPEAFTGCPGLIRLSVESGNACFTVKDGILFTKDFVVLMLAVNYADADYVVPGETVEILPGAFASCRNLKRIVIPENVQLPGERCVGYTAEGKIPDFTIYGSFDSPAYYYASVNDIAFLSLP